MESAGIQGSPATMLERLITATNAHDLEGLVDCFEPGYVNETPAHPARGFVGRHQVRANWQQIFAAVPDLHATVLRSVVTADAVWAEMEMSGVRRDGTQHLMTGVSIFGVVDGRAAWSRFYLESVEQGGPGIDVAVASQLGARP
jgi:ketosteroid isomerase-like protein